MQQMSTHTSASSKFSKDPNQNNVIIVDQEYLSKSFRVHSKQDKKILQQVSTEFSLNEEQDRAFNIIAHHSISPTDQLRMYLGGMGGTGKSQVIKALVRWFELRQESHRFVTLAPTGTAAALLSGFTYHSFLGVGGFAEKKNERTAITELQEKLRGKDYIFLDEISMLSCQDLYKISAKLSKAKSPDQPFGGLNMIFSGDFAQLPPIGGQALYMKVTPKEGEAATTSKQDSALGKALWHQITTVVILRQNMRQSSQTPQDARLRTALENMRYKACTPTDIAFLKTLVVQPGSKKLGHKKFRNVSIITALNAAKDHLNELGCQRFAADSGQDLTDFYSIDTWGVSEDPTSKKGRFSKSVNSDKKSRAISKDLQELLWNMPSGESDHIAGKLSLCLGMPIMIKNNDATELCITKGQEARVVDWHSSEHPLDEEKQVLDTLFVELIQPTKNIQLPGLPPNVVPLSRSSKTVSCRFPSDKKESISRQQVFALPNFSMTDYASQGKTRAVNVVDITNCKSHMAYYTALSRGSTAANTVIVQSFSSSVITGGAAGYLC